MSRRSRPMTRQRALTMIIVALLLMVYSGYRFFSEYGRVHKLEKQCTAVGDGIIISSEPHQKTMVRGTGRHKRRYKVTWYLTTAVLIIDGSEYRAVRDSSIQYTEGQTDKVYYDPEDPSVNYLTSTDDDSMSRLPLLLMSGVFLLYGVFRFIRLQQV